MNKHTAFHASLLLLGAALVFARSPARAQALADPTRPPTVLAAPSAASAAAAPARAASAAPPRAPRLQSVQLPRDGQACALLDGRLVFVNDKVGAATVDAIDARGLTLRHANGRTEKLLLLDAAVVVRALPSTSDPVASLVAGAPKP